MEDDHNRAKRLKKNLLISQCGLSSSNTSPSWTPEQNHQQETLQSEPCSPSHGAHYRMRLSWRLAYQIEEGQPVLVHHGRKRIHTGKLLDNHIITTLGSTQNQLLVSSLIKGAIVSLLPQH